MRKYDRYFASQDYLYKIGNVRIDSIDIKEENDVYGTYNIHSSYVILDIVFSRTELIARPPHIQKISKHTLVSFLKDYCMKFGIKLGTLGYSNKFSELEDQILLYPDEIRKDSYMSYTLHLSANKIELDTFEEILVTMGCYNDT